MGLKYDITIIIPMYNVEDYIVECLESVINQSKKDIEIIIVDDGSTDESLALASSYASVHNNIKLISKSNGGQGSARNIGIKLAEGKYVYFMDSDDYLNLHTMKELFNLAEYKHLEVILFNGIQFYDEKFDGYNKNIKQLYIKKNEYPGVQNGRNLFNKLVKNEDYTCSPCLMFIKKDLLLKKEILFEEGVIQEDELFAFKLLQNSSRVKVVNWEFFYRRLRNNSTTTSKNYSAKFIGYLHTSRGMHNIIKNLTPRDMEKKYLLTMINNCLHFYSLLTNKEKKLYKNEVNQLKYIILKNNFFFKLDILLFVINSNGYKLGRKIINIVKHFF